MTFNQLLEPLSEVDTDTKINLKRLILDPAEKILDMRSVQLVSLAISYSLQNAEIIAAARDFATELENGDSKAAAICANMMAMNNIYYRALHLIEEPQLLKLPTGLRMQTLMKHGIDKGLFELMSMAVSAINGCGMCLQAHYQQVKSHYSDQQIRLCIKNECCF